jgi:hypothetical protein
VFYALIPYSNSNVPFTRFLNSFSSSFYSLQQICKNHETEMQDCSYSNISLTWSSKNHRIHLSAKPKFVITPSFCLSHSTTSTQTIQWSRNDGGGYNSPNCDLPSSLSANTPHHHSSLISFESKFRTTLFTHNFINCRYFLFCYFSITLGIEFADRCCDLW